ncbi:MAG TPA: AzlD domain-containing protein [Bacillota bacterium]|nr:AzlD domain-containing protein [Bacillota bacterium]
MPPETKIYLVILALGLVNYLPRVVPMVLLSRLTIPEVVREWLGLVPAAVLAAIILPSLLMPEGKLDLTFNNKYLLAAVPTFLVAKKTQSLVWTLLAGMLSMAALQQII